MTLSEVQAFIKTVLTPVVGGTEASAMCRVIMEDVAGTDAVTAALYPEREIAAETVGRIKRAVERVVAGEPLQYVIGKAAFHGLTLTVRPGVLIPRPETSMLVDIILDRTGRRSDLTVLDVGTGSGAIAAALARSLPFARLTAVDVSPVAIDTASENFNSLGLKDITLVRSDILNQGLPGSNYDIIVSNPPYVDMSEMSSMDRRVVDYEPHSALFVPNNDALLFYRKIAEEGLAKLVDGGMLFFEINPRHASELQQMLRSQGYDNVTLERDISGDLRFAIADKPV